MKKIFISFFSIFIVVVLFTGCSFKNNYSYKSSIKNKYNYIYNNLQENNYIAYNKISYKKHKNTSLEFNQNIIYNASAVYYMSDNAFSIIRKYKTTGEVNECFYREGKLVDYSFYVESYIGSGSYNFESEYNNTFQDKIYDKCDSYISEMYSYLKNKK